MEIMENYSELLDIYLSKFGLDSIEDQKKITTEFNRMLLLKKEFMPYWFVLELIKMGYDVVIDENDF